MILPKRIAFLLLLFALPVSAQFTGTWNGTLTVHDRCRNAPITWSSPIVVSLIQTSDAVSGNALLASVPNYNLQCAVSNSFPLVAAVKGRANGPAFAGSIELPDEPAAISATIAGTSINVSVTGSTFTAGASLNQSSTAAPPAGFSGFYSGSYNIHESVEDCRNFNSFDYAGPIAGSVIHRGQLLSAAITATDVKRAVRDATGNCTVRTDVPFAGAISAQIAGSTFAGILVAEDELLPINGTINGTTITVNGSGEGSQFTFTMTRSTAPAPVISSFTATPASVLVGETSTLNWQVQSATSVVIDQGIGVRAVSGSQAVRPLKTTTFTLTASGPGGSTQATTTVTVTPRPRVVLSSFPRGFVQRAGEGGGRDQFTLTNVGEAPTTVTLTPTGTFFTIDAASFSLDPGANRTVTITGQPMPADVYTGTIAFSGTGVLPEGVPVRMLSATPPAGLVTARAARARAEIATNAGQSANGFVEFTNTSSEVLLAAAVSDVPWIVPQSGIIRIEPNQTVAVSFTVDSGKRPDSDAPLGALTGKISLVFPSGTPPGLAIAADGPGTSTVSVTLTYLVKPGVSPGSPPALGPGELALFVAGLGNQSSATGDLLISNGLTSAPLDRLDLYLQGMGMTPVTTSIASLQPNSSVALPGLVRNVLGTSVTSGGVQVRGPDIQKTSIAAVQTNTSLPSGTYSTALPVFRSDRAVTANDAAVLSGVDQSAAADTDLFVQETSGNSGSFRIDFLDAAGQVISSRGAEAIAAFGFAEVLDSVPPNTAAARVINTSTNAALAAYGLVSSPATGDRWVITDPAAGASGDESLIIPLFSAGAGAVTTLYTTNRGDTDAAVTIDVLGAEPRSRRRAVARSSATTPPMLQGTDASSVLAPLHTMATTIGATTGYLRVSGPGAAISAAARSVITNGTSSFGSGLPAVPQSEALGLGDSKRFAGVDDASTASRTGAVPATFQSNLMLVETADEEATVRVTVQFSFSGGSLVSSSARVSRDYALGGGQSLVITNLAREVAGPSRDSFGDLRDMIVDVEVVGGAGRVIPFLQSIDNGSLDMIVRVD
jgi:hypothetical protein